MKHSHQSPEDILNICLAWLKLGKSIDYCLTKFPKTSGLADQLAIASLIMRIPTRQANLNEASVWKQISAEIQPAQEFAPTNKKASFFHIPFPRLTGVLAGVLVCALLLNTAATASRNSIPGEALYQVKRTVEKIQLTLALDDVRKAEIQLQHAQNRLSEAKSIAEQSPASDPKVIEKALTEFTDTTTQATEKSADNNNKDLLKKVVELTGQQTAVLTDIESKVTGDTKKAVSQALDSTIESKSVAEKKLAILEGTTVTSSTTSATTTTEFIHDGDKNPDDPNKSTDATTTDGTLKALGTPSATTTEPFDPPSPSSTPLILDIP